MDQRFQQLEYWFRRASRGRLLAQIIADKLKNTLKESQATSLLQLGIFEHQQWLSSNIKANPFFVIPFLSSESSAVVSSLYEMPLRSGSVDLCICPFILELLDYPLTLLSELDRVLSDNGEIIFIGVNPVSFWGLPRLWRQPSLFPIWRSHLFSLNRLMRTMSGFNYDLLHYQRFCYAPPWLKTQVSQQVFEHLGRMILPLPTSFYLLKVQKQIFQPIMELNEPFLMQPIS